MKKSITVVLFLLAASFLSAQQNDGEVEIVHGWIQAARLHRPGAVDAHLLALASTSTTDLGVVARRLRTVLLREYPRADQRNDIVRRAALLHADIALLLPAEAARFTRNDAAPFYFDLGATPRPYATRAPDPLVYAQDGEFQASSYDTGHWWMARLLLRLITPHPSADPFVRDWYRAVAAHFQAGYNLGSAVYHLSEALNLLPHDPVLLLYAGAMHEAYASPHVQNMLHPLIAKQLKMPTPEVEWRQAERLLREAVKEKAPVEANVRLSRVLGHLGRHEEAASELRHAPLQAAERNLQYLCELFLGSEEGTLGRREAARDAFERASSLYPTAQSPLVALAHLAWTTGNRTAALEALRRISALPADPGERTDPWQDYYGSLAANPEAQLSALRESLSPKERR